VIVLPGGGRGFAVLSGNTPVSPQGAAVHVAPAPALASAHREQTSAPPWDKDSAFREWETLLTVLAVFAMVIYVFRTPAAVVFVAAIVDRPQTLAYLVSSALGGRSPSVNNTSQAWIGLASVGLALCALAWVFWGIFYLTAGARLRIAVITLAAVTLGLLAVVLSVYVSYMVRYTGRSGYLFRVRYDGRLNDPLNSGSVAERVAIDCLLPVVLLFILTRRPVKQLFSLKLRRPRPSVEP
jgi:hypothetical protein